MTIPLIRAGAVFPMFRWLEEIGRDPAPLLAQVGLDWIPQDDPGLPIPLLQAIALLRAISKAEGPDAPHRMVNELTVLDLGLIGVAALGGGTVREGFHRVAMAMRAHCTHEFLIVEDGDRALRIGERWAATIGDAETLHLVQQYAAAIVESICSTTWTEGPAIAVVSMVPHPVLGLSHLRAWLGDRVHESHGRTLDIQVANSVADRTFPPALRKEVVGLEPEQWTPLRAGDTLSDAVTTMIAAMLPLCSPTIDQIAWAGGMSRRTLQRRLGEEGMTFTELVERTRAKVALSCLSEPLPPMLKSLATELGYANQATLTRAMRRWTGQLPSDVARQRREQ